MPKLYYKYGAMGSSKSAQALMTKFNYEQKDYNVLLIKPSIDTRSDQNGKTIIASRVGIESICHTYSPNENLKAYFDQLNLEKKYDVVIVDEVQFSSTSQIDDLKKISNSIPVLCFGLKTNFKGLLFEGSKRLMEIADSITEIKSICNCGEKAIMNALLINGKVVTEGNEIQIGGDEKYEAMCYNCWKKRQS